METNQTMQQSVLLQKICFCFVRTKTNQTNKIMRKGNENDFNLRFLSCVCVLAGIYFAQTWRVREKSNIFNIHTNCAFLLFDIAANRDLNGSSSRHLTTFYWYFFLPACVRMFVCR